MGLPHLIVAFIADHVGDRHQDAAGQAPLPTGCPEGDAP